MSSDGPKAPTFQAPPWPPKREEAKPIPPAPDTSPKAPPPPAKPKTPRDGQRDPKSPGIVKYGEKTSGTMIRVSRMLTQWVSVETD